MRSSVLGLAVGLVLVGPWSGISESTEKDRPPVSTGEYQIVLGGQRIGQEQFRVFKDKGYTIESTRTLYWPEPARQEIHYELEANLEPKKLELKVTRGGIVTELKLERKGDNWKVQTKGQGRDRRTQELGRRAGTVVELDSLLFHALTLRGLALDEGQSRKVDAITLALPDLAGARAEETYRRLADEDVETAFTGTVSARVYELRCGTATHRLWVAPSGAVVKGSFERIGGEQEILLVRLASSPGTWPP
jgi:hypothetical protein